MMFSQLGFAVFPWRVNLQGAAYKASRAFRAGFATGVTQGSARSMEYDTPDPYHGDPFENKRLIELAKRYAGLRKEDQDKLMRAHAEANEIPDWTSVRAPGLESEFEKRKEAETRLIEFIKHERQRLRTTAVQRKRAPAMEFLDEQLPEIMSECFSQEMEDLSLIEDVHKAAINRDVVRHLSQAWKISDIPDDSFQDVMARAIREELADQSRPTLTNEFADYNNPFMMTQSALRRLLEVCCTRNKLDESMLPELLSRLPVLNKLRTEAPLPPEVLEPLFAFRGITNYSFDARTRLQQKTDVVIAALSRLSENGSDGMKRVLDVLPETQPSDELDPNHPFRNHFGFKTAEPWGYVGWIKAGKPRNRTEAELDALRYPTLQRVAHSLPKDPKYRANVSRVIEILERSRGWDYGSKIKAINTLKAVWDNMAPSKHYSKILDAALPVVRRPGMVKRSSTRGKTYCSGLKYIRSLTTSKPLAMRKKKK